MQIRPYSFYFLNNILPEKHIKSVLNDCYNFQTFIEKKIFERGGYHNQ